MTDDRTLAEIRHSIEAKRRQLAQLAQERPKRGRPQTAQCGTTSGYQRHHRQGEDPCKACREAWATYHLRRRLRREGWDL